MTKLFLCSGLSIILFMSVITGIRLLGDQLDSTAKHVLGPDSSELPQACWYGLCPGQQTFAQSVNDLTKIAAQQGATITDKFTAATDSHVFQYVACGEYLYPVWQSCVRSMFGPDYSYKNDAQIDLFLNEAGLQPCSY